VRDTPVQEVEVRRGGFRVRLRKSAGRGSKAKKLPESVESAAEPAVIEDGADLVDVSTPVTGVFYWAPIPGGEPFVSEGDIVHEGQIVGLVEAMKTFNEVVTHVAGTLAKFVVEDGSEVEEGSTILRVRRHDAAASSSNGPTYA
jgi:acetyl-CoA carboxylase biotin carboxyl carrier protein